MTIEKNDKILIFFMSKCDFHKNEHFRDQVIRQQLCGKFQFTYDFFSIGFQFCIDWKHLIIFQVFKE